MRRAILVAVVTVLLAPACSGEVETETFGSVPEPDLVDAIRANAASDPDRRFDDATTDCLIQGIVDEFGEDGLAELGVTPENPDLDAGVFVARPDAARRAVNVGMECIDIAGAIGSNLPIGIELLEDSVDCVAGQLETEAFRGFFAELLAAGAEPADILDYADAQLSIGALLLTCLNPEELLDVNELLP